MSWYEIKKQEIKNGQFNQYTASDIWCALYVSLITREQYNELITLLIKAVQAKQA